MKYLALVLMFAAPAFAVEPQSTQTLDRLASMDSNLQRNAQDPLAGASSLRVDYDADTQCPGGRCRLTGGTNPSNGVTAGGRGTGLARTEEDRRMSLTSEPLKPKKTHSGGLLKSPKARLGILALMGGAAGFFLGGGLFGALIGAGIGAFLGMALGKLFKHK